MSADLLNTVHHADRVDPDAWLFRGAFGGRRPKSGRSVMGKG
ncbi:MAG: hypothetical protein ACRDGV_03330 [Candidatus Limnocylindria bacterium]